MAATFAERFSTYINDMGLSNVDMVGILKAAKLQKSEQTVGVWRKGGKGKPTLKDFPMLATTLGVTEGWLLGSRGAAKWGPEIVDARLSMRARLKSIPQDFDILQRMLAVLEIMGQQSNLCNQPWFVSGVLKIERDELEAFKQGILPHHRDAPHFDTTVQRFAEFTGLSKLWLARGKPEDLEPPTDIEEYLPAILQLHDWGVTGTELARHAPTIRDLVAKNRRHIE